ncbi:MAG: 4-hydroxy-tetrahydrodipicolinate synthase [Alphaproteobacteria bacterium]
MAALDLIKGSITALITPFRNGEIDEHAYRRFVEWQIAEGTHGLVPCGTTGENPTLTNEEHMRLIEICVEAARGRAPVIAGAGSNYTEQAILLSRHSQKVGADAVLSVVPYYNKPTQEGIYRHFAKIAESVDIPIVIYNVPSRTVADICVETLARLSKIANIVGIKDATGNLARASRERAALPGTFIRLSGEDATTLGFMAHGGRGCISVTSNVAPRLCAEFQNACLAGNYELALKCQDRLMPLHDALFIETSPAPVKFAASLLGHCTDEVRLPLAPASDAARKAVRAAMHFAGIYNG